MNECESQTFRTGPSDCGINELRTAVTEQTGTLAAQGATLESIDKRLENPHTVYRWVIGLIAMLTLAGVGYVVRGVAFEKEVEAATHTNERAIKRVDASVEAITRDVSDIRDDIGSIREKQSEMYTKINGIHSKMGADPFSDMERKLLPEDRHKFRRLVRRAYAD